MSTQKPLYQALALLIQARANCARHDDPNPAGLTKHTELIQALCKEHLPSGSGFDCGAQIDLDASSPEKLVFSTSFHHMNDTGVYDGWTEHTVTVKPSLVFGFTLSISGRNRNEIKDYISESFDLALNTPIDPYGA